MMWAGWLLVFPLSVLADFSIGALRFRRSRLARAEILRENREARAIRAGLPQPVTDDETSLRRNILFLPKGELLEGVMERAPAEGATFVFGGIVMFILVVWTFWDVTIFRDIRLGADKARVTAQKGVDTTGKSATYTIILLSAEYFWKIGDTVTVVNSEGHEIHLEDKLASNGIASLINRSTDVISIGTASCVGSGAEEESRANDRARNLTAWVRQAGLSRTVEHLYMLNLGQYNEPCGYGPREREQRMVIIVGVANKQRGVDIAQSFRDAMERAAKGPLRRFDLPGYTNWPAERFKLEIAM